MDNQIAAGRGTATNTLIQSPKKVFNPIGTQSQWSLGWQDNSAQSNNKPLVKGNNSYKNQSSILLGDMKNDWKNQPVTAQKTKKFKQDTTNLKPVWNYNPKTAGTSTIFLGNQKTDFRKKDQINKQRTPTTLTISRKKNK